MISFGKIRRRKLHGRLTSTYWVRCWDPQRKRQSWRSTRCKTIQAAREWVRTQEVRQALGKDRQEAVEQAEKTFAAAYASWIGQKREKVSVKCFQTLKYQGDHFWLGFFGERALSEIDTELVQEYQRKRKSGTISHPDETRRRRIRRIGEVTLNNDLRHFGNLLKYCRLRGWMDTNPLEGIYRHSEQIRKRTRYISREEEERLLKACREPVVTQVSAKRNKGGRRGGVVSNDPVTFQQKVPIPDYLYPLVLTGLRTGLRRRTLLSLCWRHVDFQGRRWRIPAELMKSREDYCAPIAQSVVDELRRYRKHLSLSPKRVHPSATIFGLTPDSEFKRSFRNAVKRAKLTLRFHDLRRIFLNRCREKGISIETAMALTQHRSLATVLKHYREVPQRDLEHAVDALDG